MRSSATASLLLLAAALCLATASSALPSPGLDAAIGSPFVAESPAVQLQRRGNYDDLDDHEESMDYHHPTTYNGGSHPLGVMDIHEDRMMHPMAHGPVIVNGGQRVDTIEVHQPSAFMAPPLSHTTTTIIQEEEAIPFGLAGMNLNAAVVNPALLSTSTFYAHEVFALFNRHKKTCLAWKPDDKKPALITIKCDERMDFSVHPEMQFHWIPATVGENNLAYLATMINGLEQCASRKHGTTHFYPCNKDSMTYTVSTTNKKGQVMIRDAKRSSKCMDTYRHKGLHMSLCNRRSRDQRFEKVHLGFI
jgi:hypothetical protein